MKTMHPLENKISIGYSSSNFTSEQWQHILGKYAKYIHDIYFSPIEELCFQTRRNTYNFKTTTIEERSAQLADVVKSANELGIKTKLVLNVPNMISNVDDNVKQYFLYKERFSIDYVTTFVSVAEEIKKIDPDVKLLCSYNQGITSIEMLKEILEKNIFCAIVLGERFLHNFKAFDLVKSHDTKMELLVNNGCMLNCGSFCSTYGFCEGNFYKNLSEKGILGLYAETSILPEELYQFYIPSGLIDVYKLSTRPCEFWELSNMLESYVSGNSESYIKENIRNYHLYARLAFFMKYYTEMDYSMLISEKRHIWNKLGFNTSD